MSNHDLVLRLFLQLTIILAACRLVGRAGRLLGQTQVVSEMIAGVLLGPSLFGLMAPAVQEWLFPRVAVIATEGGSVTIAHPSMAILFAISQVGLALYMFLVGLEFNASMMTGRMRSAGLVSGAGIVVPFVLGATAGLFMAGDETYFHGHVAPGAAALYLGASMAITAFPMLARILDEKRIAGTRMGTLALAAGAMDDAVAWCLLAIVLAWLKATPLTAFLAIGGGLLYVLGMIFVGRPLLARFGRAAEREGGISPSLMVGVLMVIMLCGWVTDRIGIYSVFGAFICGAVMPRGRFSEEMLAKTSALTTSLLLPVFFVYSGLNTRIGLVNTPALFAMTALLIALAILGKGVACTLAARAAGETWRSAAAIGTLMNARGLMELIILNIGLQEGVITPTLFTMMVLMAILTTLIASPLFELFHRRSASESGTDGARAPAVAR